jgi:hypothetical protein
MQYSKFSAGTDRQTEPFIYPNTWKQERTTGADRLVIAPSSRHIDLIRKLIQVLPEPFGLLYVLATPRRGESGRYQSPEPSSRGEVESFLWEFKDFFQGDGRHHIWITSLPSNSTIVYDNHDILYAYGPLEHYKRILTAEGLSEGDVPDPIPHTHHFNVQFDQSQQDVLAYWDWVHYPLTDRDE